MRRIFDLFVLLALALSVPAAQAAEKTKIRFTLDWKLQGIHAWYFWAQEKGYFAAENLDVTIDQGEGSAATINRIMSGAYDAGFGDTNAVIQTAAVKPGEAPRPRRSGGRGSSTSTRPSRRPCSSSGEKATRARRCLI